MKILLGFTILSSLYACGQITASEKEKFATIYIAGCDSIFYCKGAKLNIETLKGSKRDDSVFINKMVTEFQQHDIRTHIKVFGGCYGGTTRTVEDFTHLFDRKKIKWMIAEPDSLEENYFKDISLLKAIQQIKIELNEPKKEVTLTDNKPFFQFVLKGDEKVYYSYDSTDLNRNLVLINNPTKEELVKALNNVETKHNIKLQEEQIIIRGDAQARYPSFRIIKDALKAKEFFRFRIITSNPPKQKEPEVEIPLVITAKTLTLLLSGTDEIYYYHGKDCSSMIKSTMKEIKTVLKYEKTNTLLKDMMIVIKQDESGTFKAVIDILDNITLSKIPAKHFAEIEITEAEINCIKNYKIK